MIESASDSPRRRLASPAVRRLLAVALTVAAAIAWRFAEPGYGPLFWLWVLGVALYASSFAGATKVKRGAPLSAWLIFGGILLLAAWLRFPDVYDIPANVSIDELLPGWESKQLADGQKPNAFGSIGWFTIPNVAFLPAALLMELPGIEPFYAVRLGSVLTGLAGITATFLLALRLFGARAALAAAFFMAVGFLHLHNSRTGFPFAQSSFGPALVLYLIARAQQERSARLLAIAGVVCGVVLQLYFPVRILLVLAPLFLLLHGYRCGARIPELLRQAAIFGVAVALMLAPLVICVGPTTLLEHSNDVLITQPAVAAELKTRYRVDTWREVFERNVWEATRMFTQRADVAVLNVSPAGILDRGTLALFCTGIVLALLAGRIEPLLMVLWFAVTFTLGVALGNAPRSSYRLAASLPAIYILAAYSVECALYATDGARRWYRLSVRLLVLAALAGWVLSENHRLFFVEYTRGDGKQTPWPEAFRYMARNCDGRRFYIMPRSDFSEATFINLFCTEHADIDAAQIPIGVETDRRATFLVMGDQINALAALRRCYPQAAAVEHKTIDGVPLFSRVDVDIAQLIKGADDCPQPAFLWPPKRI